MGGWVGDRLGTTGFFEDLTGTTARREAKEQQRRFEEEQALAEEERRQAETGAIERMEEERRRQATRGRASTLLTGPRGVEEGITPSARTLLGA
jgi:hypothetical protein